MARINPTKVSTRTKQCKAKVRDGSKHVACDTKYSGESCPRRDYHLLKIKTGYCNNGWCEGAKAKDWRGNPVPTCKFFLTCPCKCHDELSKLFEMTDSDRIVVESSGYSPPERAYWMPSDNPELFLSKNNASDTPTLVESPAPDVVPATLRHTFTPTPSGRAARGELEMWVKQECDAWLVDKPGEPCTPAYLSEEISRVKGIAPPSVGAINSIFERWTKLGFAVIEKKPTRFVKYTDEGVRLGLEAMKLQAKRAKKLRYADDKRNLRR